MSIDTLSALDAPLDEDFDAAVEGVEIGEEQEQKVAEPEKKAEPEQPLINEDSISDKVIGKLMQLADARQPGNQMQVSPLQKEIQELKNQGVPQEAIDNFLKLQIATHQELSARQQAQAQQIFIANYREGLRAEGHEALLAVAAGIKPIANNEGLRNDLVEQMGELIMRSPEYADIRKAIDSFKAPSKNRLKEVAAKVADKWCGDNELTKPKAGLDIKSSRPEPSDTKFDVNTLSKKAAMIYNITLKATNDKKIAQKRALSV